MTASGGGLGIAIVGAGGWGTTLAVLAARRHPVLLLARSAERADALERDRENRLRLPGVRFPAGLVVTADPARIRHHGLVVFAAPSPRVRETARSLARFVDEDAVVVSAVKGLEDGTLARMSEVLADELGGPDRIAVLSGPNLAPEIARGLPASAVVAAREPATADRVVAALGTRRFRLYVSGDVIGVEIGGAFKNVIAIAAGAAQELGFGDNGTAGLITRGLAEMIRLGAAAGADPLTFAGLAGVGDLIATCSSPISRNHRVGVELARGRRLEEIATDAAGVVEGVNTVRAAIALGDRLGVELTIAREVAAALFDGRPVERCLVSLLARERRDEVASATV